MQPRPLDSGDYGFEDGRLVPIVNPEVDSPPEITGDLLDKFQSILDDERRKRMEQTDKTIDQIARMNIRGPVRSIRLTRPVADLIKGLITPTFDEILDDARIKHMTRQALGKIVLKIERDLRAAGIESMRVATLSGERRKKLSAVKIGTMSEAQKQAIREGSLRHRGRKKTRASTLDDASPQNVPGTTAGVSTAGPDVPSTTSELSQ